MVDGGWWMVDGGWWMVNGGWWMVNGEGEWLALFAERLPCLKAGLRQQQSVAVGGASPQGEV